MRFATCWLLAALTATTALAQTHPKKKTVRKSVVQQSKRDKESVKKVFRRDIHETFKQDIHEDFTQDGEQSQPAPLDYNRVYTYVEQMPTLNGQSSFVAITAAIHQQLVLPLAAPAGRTFVQFVVTKEGAVTKPQIVKGLRADVDSAVVVATRKLPRFKPGKQNGQVVAVSYTLAIPVGAPVVAKPAAAPGKE